MSVRRETLCTTLSLLFLAAAASGQEEPFAPPSADFNPTRKRPSVFHRPRKESPPAQLAHAARLHVEGRDKQAAKQYLALVHQWHDSPEAVRAQLAYAEIVLARETPEKAFQEFQYLVDEYAGRFPLDRVLDYQLDIAHRVRTKKRGAILFYSGFTAPERALPLLQRIVNNAPNWTRASEAQFYQAKIREALKEYSPAADAYEVLQSRYPQSTYAAESNYRRAVCLWELSRRSPRDEQRCRTAIGAMQAFLNDRPENKNANDAKKKLDALNEQFAGLVYKRAVFYDKSARRPSSALIAYREYLKRFPLSSMAAEAHKRITALEQEQEARNAE